MSQQSATEVSSSSVTTAVAANVDMNQADLENETECIFDKHAELNQRIEKVEQRTNDIDARMAIRQRWPNHERQPRKMPYNSDFLTRNDPTKGLLHEDDRDPMNPYRQVPLQPRSTYDPWDGQIDPYAHESNWTNGPWGPRSTPNRGPTWGTGQIQHPVDNHRWDSLRDEPIKPYYMMQPLEVCHLYFSASLMERPSDTISKWLYDKLGGIPDAGLTAHKIIGAFYPLTYDHWTTRQMLNLTDDSSTENIDRRGPPHIVKTILQQCDLFKVHCVTVHAKPLSEHRIRSLLSTYNLEECHFKFRYKIFNGYFPTFKWMVSPHADMESLQQTDIYVLFSYSEGDRSLLPHDTMAVELLAWLDEIRRINMNNPTLPPIVGNTRPLL